MQLKGTFLSVPRACFYFFDLVVSAAVKLIMAYKLQLSVSMSKHLGSTSLSPLTGPAVLTEVFHHFLFSLF
jgi:hypothetical protein